MVFVVRADFRCSTGGRVNVKSLPPAFLQRARGE
jgi:hypothetical protein